MGLVSPTQISATDSVVPEKTNTPINQLAAVINGGLDNTNIASGAGIALSKIDLGSDSSGGVWFEELGRTTLSSSSDTITLSSLPARKYLRVVIYCVNSGQIGVGIRFNNDSGNNYAYRSEINGAADSTVTSTSSILACDQQTQSILTVIDIVNTQANEKQVSIMTNRNATGAATAPGKVIVQGKWANTAAQINRIDAVNGGTGDYAVGSEMVVLGHN